LNGSGEALTQAGDQCNPAYDINAAFNIGQRGVMAEYVTTIDDQAFTGKKADAMITGLSCRCHMRGKLSVVGFEVRQHAWRHIWLGAEVGCDNNVVGG
jgi:hypothetical protein